MTEIELVQGLRSWANLAIRSPREKIIDAAPVGQHDACLAALEARTGRPIVESYEKLMTTAAALRFADAAYLGKQVAVQPVDWVAPIQREREQCLRLDLNAQAEELARLIESIDAVDGRQSLSDGLHVPNLLVVDGRIQRLPPIQWKLAQFMWSRRTATVEELSESVWEDSEVADTTVRATVTKLNNAILTIPGVNRYLDLGVKAGHVVNESSNS